MSQSFESLLLEIEHAIKNAETPSALTSALYAATKKAEEYEDEWINSLYEQSEDGFKDFIY